MSDLDRSKASESYRIADEKLKILREAVERQVRNGTRSAERSNSRQAAG